MSEGKLKTHVFYPIRKLLKAKTKIVGGRGHLFLDFAWGCGADGGKHLREEK